MAASAACNESRGGRSWYLIQSSTLELEPGEGNTEMTESRIVVLCIIASLASGCSKSESTKPESTKPPAPSAPTPAELRTKAKALFGPLPAVMESPKHKLTPEKIELGHKLYFDTRLSRGQELSCASCHDLNGYGIDTRPEAIQEGRSFGHKRQLGERNAPSTYNAALHVAQFWDGRASDVEEQAKGPILNPVEMTMADEGSVMAVLKSVPGYEPLFKAAFPDSSEPLTFDNMAQAIGAYERTLVTPGRFDKFLLGDDAALGPQEREGLAAFMDAGCFACHMGPGVGGGMFQKLGLIKPYPTADKGRAAVTKNPADTGFFKVPSLRNVAKTAPYFHDGSIKTLPQAVAIMAEHQTAAGKLPDAKVKQIVVFLESLTGDIPTSKIDKPEMPANGPKTPAGDPNFSPAPAPSTAKVPAPK
ncbi:MAG: Cytochrome peroxidase [Myxococcaceae bacterium]|nr:Cytochrome peroxidase [Myxococcaceae bacterium]